MVVNCSRYAEMECRCWWSPPPVSAVIPINRAWDSWSWGQWPLALSHINPSPTSPVLSFSCEIISPTMSCVRSTPPHHPIPSCHGPIRWTTSFVFCPTCRWGCTVKERDWFPSLVCHAVGNLIPSCMSGCSKQQKV